jgi:tRNA modification GTPase
VRLTPPVAAAVGVIAVWGDDAHRILLDHWEPATGSPALAIGRIRYGQWWLGGRSHNVAGRTAEQVLLCQIADGCFELHCHGGPTAGERLLSDLRRSGADCSPHGDPLAALPPVFLGLPQIGGIESDALEDLIGIGCKSPAAILLDQARGALRRRLEAIVAQLSHGEAEVAGQGVNQLRQSYRQLGSRLLRPWRITLAGPPNVGKSSLFNAWLGYHRALADPAPGTTRDLLEETLTIEGWPIRISDVAGIRASTDAIEQQGIALAQQRMAETDLTLLLVAADQGWTDTHRQLQQAVADKHLLVGTKADLVAAPENAGELSGRVSWAAGKPLALWCSVSDAASLERVLQAALRRMLPITPPTGWPTPFREAHDRQLAAAEQEITAGNLTAARTRLTVWLESGCVVAPESTVWGG